MRRSLGLGISIYFISRLSALLFLSEPMPKGLGVRLGVMRMWWPDVSTDSDPSEHPLITDSRSHKMSNTTQSLIRELRLSEHSQLTAEQQLERVERQRTAAQYRIRDLERHLRSIRHEHDNSIDKSQGYREVVSRWLSNCSTDSLSGPRKRVR